MTEYDKCSEGYDMLQKYFEVMPKKFRHSNLFMHCGISTKVFDVTKISNTKLLIDKRVFCQKIANFLISNTIWAPELPILTKNGH